MLRANLVCCSTTSVRGASHTFRVTRRTANTSRNCIIARFQVLAPLDFLLDIGALDRRISLLVYAVRISLLARLLALRSTRISLPAAVWIAEVETDSIRAENFACLALWWVRRAKSHCSSVIPLDIVLITQRLLASAVFGAPMDDNSDDHIEWAGSLPNHLTAPALRGVKNALLQGSTLEVERDNVTVRVINGLDQHSDTSQKETILSAKVTSPGNTESRKIIPNGNRLMLARGIYDHPLIQPYRKFRLVSNGNIKNPLESTHRPSKEQVEDLGWFCRGTSLIKIGLPTMAAYPKLGSISALCGLGASGNSAGFYPEYSYNQTESISGDAKGWIIENLAGYLFKAILIFCCIAIGWPLVKEFGVGHTSQFVISRLSQPILDLTHRHLAPLLKWAMTSSLSRHLNRRSSRNPNLRSTFSDPGASLNWFAPFR